MSEIKYTTVDRIFNTLYRSLKDENLNETDVIDWIGEALEFLQVYPLLEEVVSFLQVENFEAPFPECVYMISQIAKHNTWSGETTAEDVVDELVSTAAEENNAAACSGDNGGVELNCNGELSTLEPDYAYYRPLLNLKWEYDLWTTSYYYQRNFTPVRLSNNTFFNTVVANSDKRYEGLYKSIEHEYQIIGNVDKVLRFSFEEGYVAVSYLRFQIDDTTGYPLVPDQISFIKAIENYIKWQLQEWYSWNGRQGAVTLAERYKKEWERKARQAKNWAKMPKSLDRYQNLMEQSRQIVPINAKYSDYFRKFNTRQWPRKTTNI